MASGHATVDTSTINSEYSKSGLMIQRDIADIEANRME
jgi:hypothetical protein